MFHAPFATIHVPFRVALSLVRGRGRGHDHAVRDHAMATNTKCQ